MSATEQKTILEELIEEAPAQRERRHKITKAKHCISREEWDAAAELLNEVLAEFPDDENALEAMHHLESKKAFEEQHERKSEERQLAAKQTVEKQKEALRSKKAVVAILLILVMVAAAVAAVLGISAHREKIRQQLAQENIVISETAAEGICQYSINQYNNQTEA